MNFTPINVPFESKSKIGSFGTILKQFVPFLQAENNRITPVNFRAQTFARKNHPPLPHPARETIALASQKQKPSTHLNTLSSNNLLVRLVERRFGFFLYTQRDGKSDSD